MKTEASDLKESDVAKVGVDVSSESMEGETPSEGERKMDKEIIEKYNYKGYEISFIRYKDPKTGEYLSDKVKSMINMIIKRHSGILLIKRKTVTGSLCLLPSEKKGYDNSWILIK